LLGAGAAVFTALYVLLTHNKPQQDMQKRKQYNFFWLATTIALAVTGIGVFLLTEDLSLPVGWATDKWTILNVAILTIETITIWLCLKPVKQAQIHKQN
jgi:hypothetical protein